MSCGSLNELMMFFSMRMFFMIENSSIFQRPRRGLKVTYMFTGGCFFGWYPTSMVWSPLREIMKTRGSIDDRPQWLVLFVMSCSRIFVVLPVSLGPYFGPMARNVNRCHLHESILEVAKCKYTFLVGDGILQESILMEIDFLKKKKHLHNFWLSAFNFLELS